MSIRTIQFVHSNELISKIKCIHLKALVYKTDHLTLTPSKN